MLLHQLTRFARAFATGALVVAVALVGLDQFAPQETSLRVAWLWLGGHAAVAVGLALSAIARL